MDYVGLYNILPKPNNRIKNTFYYKKGQLLWWDGKRLRNKEKDKEYRDKNKAKAKEKRDKPGNKEKAKELRDTPGKKAKRKEYMNEYLERPGKKARAKELRDKPARKAKKKEYNKEYKQKPQTKDRNNKRHKERMKTDLAYRIAKNLKSRHYQGLKSQNLEPTIPVLELMECSDKFLIIHLESHFEPGMTWDNYGNKSGCWNIDHRRCYDSLELKYIEEQRKCCHWTNLQPMWKPENLAKGNHFDEATFEYKWIDTNLGWIKK